MGFSVSKFNKDGTLIKRIGDRGQGPGEFSYEPKTLALLKDTLFVADFMGNIQLFNLNLEFVKKLPGLLPSSFVVDVVAKKLIASKGSIKDIDIDLIFYNSKFEKTSSVSIEDLSEYPNVNTFEKAVDESHIILVFYHQNRIDIRDKNGVLVRKLSMNKLPKNVPLFDNTKIMLRGIENIFKKGSKRKLPEFNKNSFIYPQKKIFRSLAVDSYGHIFIQGGDYSEKGQIYVLNYQGDLLTSFKLPEGSRLMHIDQFGFLYASAEHRTLLKKYKIEYEGF